VVVLIRAAISVCLKNKNIPWRLLGFNLYTVFVRLFVYSLVFSVKLGESLSDLVYPFLVLLLC